MAAVYKAGEAGACAALAGSSCAFGVFDGVHRGHKHLLDCAWNAAEEGKRTVLTFDIDPDELFCPESLRKLMPNEARIAALLDAGADAVVLLPFSSKLASLEPATFLERAFDEARPASLHVGSDFRFGARASGTVDDLEAWGKRKGVSVRALGLACEDGAPITATRIRALLAEGRIEQANALLGHPYTMEGLVEHGRGEGAGLGFRTANLAVPANLRALGDGVYAAWAFVDGAPCKAAVSMGVPATFADCTAATCEVHLLDFEGDLYGCRLKVEFRHWLRAMKKFDDVDELVATVKANIAWVRENL